MSNKSNQVKQYGLEIRDKNGNVRVKTDPDDANLLKGLASLITAVGGIILGSKGKK